MTPIRAVLSTFFMAMIPVIELRGAIPAGVISGLSPWVAMLIAVVGNMVPVPFLILFTRKIFDWLKTKSKIKAFVENLEARAHEKSKVVLKYARIGLCILVAIPLPGTGAWTGALVAVILNMRLKDCLPTITLGVLIAGIIVTMTTYGVTLLL